MHVRTARPGSARSLTLPFFFFFPPARRKPSSSSSFSCFSPTPCPPTPVVRPTSPNMTSPSGLGSSASKKSDLRRRTLGATSIVCPAAGKRDQSLPYFPYCCYNAVIRSSPTVQLKKKSKIETKSLPCFSLQYFFHCCYNIFCCFMVEDCSLSYKTLFTQ